MDVKVGDRVQVGPNRYSEVRDSTAVGFHALFVLS